MVAKQDTKEPAGSDGAAAIAGVAAGVGAFVTGAAIAGERTLRDTAPGGGLDRVWERITKAHRRIIDGVSRDLNRKYGLKDERILDLEGSGFLSLTDIKEPHFANELEESAINATNKLWAQIQELGQTNPKGIWIAFRYGRVKTQAAVVGGAVAAGLLAAWAAQKLYNRDSNNEQNRSGQTKHADAVTQDRIARQQITTRQNI